MYLSLLLSPDHNNSAFTGLHVYATPKKEKKYCSTIHDNLGRCTEPARPMICCRRITRTAILMFETFDKTLSLNFEKSKFVLSQWSTITY